MDDGIYKLNSNYYNSLITIFLFSVCISSCLGILVQYYWKRRRMYAMASKIPGPKGYPLIGNIDLVTGTTEDVLNNAMNLVENNQLPTKIWIANRLFFATSDPEHLKILYNNEKSLQKHETLHFLKPIVGNGLFSAPLELWKKNRRLIVPTFNQTILNSYVVTFYEKATILVDILRENTGKMMNINEFIHKFTFDTICRTSMGTDLSLQINDSGTTEWSDRLANIICNRMCKLWLYPDFIFYNLPIGKEFITLTNRYLSYTEEVIAHRKLAYKQQKEWSRQHPEAQTEEKTKWKSFLDLLMELTNEENIFSDEQFRDEVNTFLTAGSDTSAIVLSYTCIMLGMHPDIQQKVYEEVLDIVGTERPIEQDDLPKLKYTEMVLMETNRLFPVGAIIFRAIEGDIELGDATIPAGSSVVMVILHTQRSKKYWKEPLKFDPDRFLTDELNKRHPYTYLPFAAGPRGCIGKKYAMMLMKLTIAHMIRNFKLSTCYKKVDDIKLKQDILLVPVNGFMVQLESRD